MTWHLVTPTCSRIMTWAPLRGCGSLPTFTSICDTLGDLVFLKIFFFKTILFTRRSLTLLTVLMTLTLYLLLTLLILTLIMHTLRYDTCITMLLTLI